MTVSFSARDDDRVRRALVAIVEEYRRTADVPRLLEQVQSLAAAATTHDLVTSVTPWREMHEVAGPIYEVIVAREPSNAVALVGLANAYWLTGRGPDVVGELASRALAADPSNRAAWHLWALTEPSPRRRVQRWQQVSERFPTDELAKANLADNAASLAAAEDDPVALKLAIETYTALRSTASHPAQIVALDKALEALRTVRS